MAERRGQFLALLPPHVDEHPLGCHRPRIDDAVVFDKLIEALVFDAGYERIADTACSATTMRRRRDEWIRLGIFDALRLAALDAYDKMVGLDLADVAVACSAPQSAIGENGFAVLADPEGLVEAENIVPLVREDVRGDVAEVLDEVSAALDTETLKAMVGRVESAQQDPRQVAEDFLAQ